MKQEIFKLLKKKLKDMTSAEIIESVVCLGLIVLGLAFITYYHPAETFIFAFIVWGIWIHIKEQRQMAELASKQDMLQTQRLYENVGAYLYQELKKDMLISDSLTVDSMLRKKDVKKYGDEYYFRYVIPANENECIDWENIRKDLNEELQDEVFSYGSIYVHKIYEWKEKIAFEVYLGNKKRILELETELLQKKLRKQEKVEKIKETRDETT